MSRELETWLDEAQRRGDRLFAKRLAGNDTLATEANQAGPYLPKDVVFPLFPQIAESGDANPDALIPALVDSHGLPEREVRVVWYNNRSRDECRMTRWGGRSSPVLDPESTGALCLISFETDDNGHATACRVWVCRDVAEESAAEDLIGEVVPTQWLFLTWDPGVVAPAPARHRCWLPPDQIPPNWLHDFPTTREVHQRALELHSARELSPDKRLLARRECEYQLFLSVEEATTLPRIRRGFASVDDFVRTAASVMHRRKARSGLSLELHVETILREEGVNDFARGARTEAKKSPDFLFPSAEAYRNPEFPRERLRMLAVKTTCKDRWRQVLDEAKEIPVKHLLTIQEGVSENQFRQMREANLQLVVPTPLHKRFPKSVRPFLTSIEQLIIDMRNLQA